MTIENIVFFQLSFGTGGEILTYLRMARWLAKNTSYTIHIFDRAESPFYGYLHTYYEELINKLIFVHPYHTDSLQEKKLDFPPNSVVVTNGVFLCHDEVLSHINAPHAKWLFYFLEPHTYLDLLRDVGFIKGLKLYPKIKKELRVADAKQALLMQDFPNYHNLKKFYPKLRPSYQPLAIEKPQFRENWELKPDFLHVAYIGRNASSKNYSLRFIAKKLNRYARSKKIHIVFSIIRDFAEKSLLYQKIRYQNPCIETRFLGTLFGQKLTDFLKDQVDVVMAMGTSCLEAGRRGLLALSVPASSKKLPGRSPVGFLSDFKDFLLGGFVGENNALTRAYPFDDALDLLRSAYRSLLQVQNEYIKHNFDVDVNMNLFLRKIKNTSFELSDLG